MNRQPLEFKSIPTDYGVYVAGKRLWQNTTSLKPTTAATVQYVTGHGDRFLQHSAPVSLGLLDGETFRTTWRRKPNSPKLD